MDSLYKLVFGNKYLNSYIFNFVQNIEYNGNFKSTYNEIENSFNIVDLEIGVLLKKRKYGLLSTMIDNYFKKLMDIQDDNSNNVGKQLLWYYNLNPNKSEIRQLLRWNGLGFNRFKLMYDEFKQIFDSTGKELIKNAFIGGNYEIVEFLIQKGYPLDIDVQFSNSELNKFNCGGNILLFEMIMDSLNSRGIEISSYDKSTIIIGISSLMTNQYNNHYKSVTNYNYYVKHTHETNVWISESPSTSLKYCGIFKLLLSGIIAPHNIQLLSGICFKQANLSLGKALIESINEHNIINPLNQHQQESPTNNLSKSSIIYNSINYMFDYTSNLILSDETYAVIKYFFENYNGNSDKIEDVIKFVSISKFEKGKNIYRLNIENEEINLINFHEIIKSCLQDKHTKYYPNSIQEFKFILNNFYLSELFNNTMKPSQLFIHISNKLGDLEYLKYAINYYYGDKSRVPSSLNIVNSTFEIASWLLSDDWKYSDQPQEEKHKFSFNSSNMEVIELAKSLNIPILAKSLLENAIRINNYELFLYSIKSIPLGKESEDQIYNTYHNDRFDMFKYIMENKIDLSSFEIERSDIRVISLKSLNPLFLSYWLNIKQQQNQQQDKSNETPTQQILKSIYLYNDYKFINDSKPNPDNIKNVKAIQFNSTKVLGYLISNSDSLLDNILENKFIISNLVRFNSKKLIYLLNLKGIGNLNNESLKYIILQSILSNNYLVLLHLANYNDGSGESKFKNKFYQYFLLYSIFTINKKKFKQNSNGIKLSLISRKQLFNYYNSDCVDLDKFNSDFSNLISIENISKSRLLVDFDSFLTHHQQQQQQTNIKLNNFLKMIIIK